MRENLEAFLVKDIDSLSLQERRAIMIIRDGHAEEARVERFIRDVFVSAIVTRSSDIHISGRKDNKQNLAIHVSVRTPSGLINFRYEDSSAGHFETKLFQLTATPQGGSTPDIISTRFSMELPAHYARAHELAPHLDEPYEVDVRVQYVKTYNGFSFVCRLLDQQRAPKLDELGLTYSLRRVLDRVILEPSGLILVSGPTGSGKTTLLNAILDQLNDGERCINTIENPVEFRLKGVGPINQIQVQGEITFARALRAILRCDPEIILVGEIRDKETMDIALSAAQTGHLVLATIHANSGPETISRALDLTLDKTRDSYRLAEVLKFVMAQRLLDAYDGPTTSRPLTRDEAAWLNTNGMEFVTQVAEVVEPTRRSRCALIEAIEINEGIKDSLRSQRLNTAEVYRHAREQLQYETLAMAGVRAVETLGSRLGDCMTRLESTSEAERSPALRSRLAKQYGMSLAEVSDAIDVHCRLSDAGGKAPLEESLVMVRESRRAVQGSQGSSSTVTPGQSSGCLTGDQREAA